MKCKGRFETCLNQKKAHVHLYLCIVKGRPCQYNPPRQVDILVVNLLGNHALASLSTRFF